MRHLLVLVVVLVVVAPTAAQQTDAPSLPFEPCDWLAADPIAGVAGLASELHRLAEITGAGREVPRGLRRASDQVTCRAADSGGLVRVRPVAPSLRLTQNTGYPEDRNNGGVWNGRGLNGVATAGVRLEVGPFSLGLAPEAYYSANEPYERPVAKRPGYHDSSNPFYLGIDHPLRFGAEPLNSFSPGQSYARLDLWKLSAGASTENVWLGASPRNPILFSNTAEGFPHIFVRTSAPVDLWFASVDVSVVLGRVEESAFFDSIPSNDEGRIGAWSVSIRPRGLDELELGVGRSYRYDPKLAPSHALGRLGISAGDRIGLGMTSIFGRFLLPESGAEVWGEWARTEGYTTAVDDLLMEPEHGQAFVVGFQKVSDSWIPLRFLAEAAHLQEKQRERLGRALPVIYTHPVIRQGHTHEGQLLGASIGPGADAQYIELDWLFGRGFAGVFVERLRRNDASKAAADVRFDSFLHDTQLTGGLRGTAFIREILLGATASYNHRIRRDFMITDDSNVSLSVDLSWWPQP